MGARSCSSLGCRGDQSGSFKLLEALATQVVNEKVLNIIPNILDITVNRSTLSNDGVVEEGAEMSNRKGLSRNISYFTPK